MLGKQSGIPIPRMGTNPQGGDQGRNFLIGPERTVGITRRGRHPRHAGNQLQPVLGKGRGFHLHLDPRLAYILIVREIELVPTRIDAAFPRSGHGITTFNPESAERPRTVRVMSPNRRPSGLGGHALFGIGSLTIRPEVRHTVIERREDTRQFLMTASGREAVLRVGERVPYIEWISEYTWRGGYVTQRVNWQDVGAYLVVQPTILDGELIHIRLIPELRGYAEDAPERLRFAELATEVYVRNGQTVALGGLERDREFYSRFLIGFDRRGEYRSLDIELTPAIVAPASR